jgi:hypothetical protein
MRGWCVSVVLAGLLLTTRVAHPDGKLPSGGILLRSDHPGGCDAGVWCWRVVLGCVLLEN